MSSHPTAVLYTPSFLEHQTGVTHPESPHRVSLIKNKLESMPDLCWLEPTQASDVDILRCHTPEHLELVQLACTDAQKYGHAALDLDTPVSAGSWEAARLASGGVLSAIDSVMAGESENAFVLVRPPGHHATQNRAMGFCLFNNVAIGARYIQEKHNLERVLIVDWDVHHGNGTQDIFYSDPSVFYYSLHQFPHYPGTGSRSETGSGTGQGYTLNIPLVGGTSAASHVVAFQDGLKTILSRFQPDFILISAGFDAHRFDPLGDMNLSDQDFMTLTQTLKHVAEEQCQGRLVSLLEGGYNLETLPQTVASHVRALATVST
ncbi:MAG: histone deacetylase [Acidobacteria bacterium]|nr:histone deacetylase [Acidobacteriota bacterium]